MSEELAAQIFSSTRQVACMGVVPLVALLLAATWFDVRSHRIPNTLVFWGALAGILLNVTLPQGRGFISVLPGGLGFLDALTGLGIGLAVFLPVYLLRAMGAGDVKLIAMVGAFLGPAQIWGAMFGVALAGGILALMVALRQGVFVRMLQNIRLMLYGSLFQVVAGGMPTVESGSPPAAKLPYGLAIALGTFGYLAYKAIGVGLI